MPFLVLGIALILSAVAAWYSIVGLMALFAAAAIPVAIMASSLEVAKLITASWLYNNWKRAPRFLKYYLSMAVVVLMFLTSMGIFGFLSKAHLDQAIPSGDVAAKVQLLDEKIKTEKDNIEVARKALRQMDEAVDQTMARSNDEKGADKAAALRRQQQKERANLQNDIAKAQKNIAALNEERAPIATELRKVEAEVGPIKYVAALIYGDNPDQAILEKAVRFVIITLIFVFDPLAVLLVIAANMHFAWLREEQQIKPKEVYYAPTDNNNHHDDHSSQRDEPGFSGLDPVVEPIISEPDPVTLEPPAPPPEIIEPEEIKTAPIQSIDVIIPTEPEATDNPGNETSLAQDVKPETTVEQVVEEMKAEKEWPEVQEDKPANWKLKKDKKGVVISASLTADDAPEDDKQIEDAVKNLPLNELETLYKQIVEDTSIKKPKASERWLPIKKKPK